VRQEVLNLTPKIYWKIVMKLFFAAVGAMVVSACTGPLNSDTLAGKPTGYLCRLLGPDYVTLPSEEEAIYRELERRGTQCVATNRVIIN
jgi:hypothetical protein